MERKCVIILTPDSDNKADIQTGGVTNIEVLDMLKSIEPHFAREVIKDYVEITGDKNVDPEKLGDYMDFLRKTKL